MARKPREQWSPAYRARVERAEARARAEGRTLRPGEARGHKPAEHRTREEAARRKAEVLGTLTSNERYAVKAFAKEQAGKVPEFRDDPEKMDRFIRALQNWAEAVGFENFRRVRATQRELRREYRREVDEGSYESRGLGLLQGIADALGDGVDYRWLFYHT